MKLIAKCHSRKSQLFFFLIIYAVSVCAYATEYVGFNSDNRFSSDLVSVTATTALTTVTDIDIDSSALYQVSSQDQVILVSGPVSKETSQYQTLDTSISAEYTISDSWSVSSVIAGYTNRQTSTATDDMVNKDNGVSRFGMGVSYELTQCHCTLSLDLPLSELVIVNGQSKKLNAKAMTMTGQWNVPVDPIVFSLEGSATLRRAFTIDDITVDLGNSYTLASTINFAVNDQVTLSGGLNISRYDAQVIGLASSASSIGLRTKFGVGYMLNSSLSLLVSYSQARDAKAEDVAVSISFNL